MKRTTPNTADSNRSEKPVLRINARKWLGFVACLAAIAVVGMGVYWLSDTPAEPPVVDLSKADPEVARAIQAAREKVVLEPKSSAAWGELAQVLHVHDFAADAIACYAQAERLDPAEPHWPYLQSVCIGRTDPDKQLASLRRAVAAAKDQPALKMALVETLLERERLEEVEPLLMEVLERNPNNAFALYGMASIAFARGDLPLCKQHLERSLAQQSQVRGPHLLLAQVCQQLGEEARAEKERQLAAQITVERYWSDPYLDKLYQHEVGEAALLKRAELLSLSGDPAGAERVLINAVGRHPGSARLHAELGKVWLFFRRLPQAEAELREALRFDPNHVNANYFLGMNLRLQKKYAEAIDYQRKAVKLQEQFAPAWYETGMCLEATSDKPGAIKAYREAVRHGPDMGQAYKQLGILLFQANLPAEARAPLQQAAVLLPNDAEVKKLLAEIPPEKK